MASPNRELAAVFQRMADVLEVSGANRFRVIGFANASRAIDSMTRSVEGMSKKELVAVTGIGEGTADRILEFLDTGRVADHDELVAKVPAGVLDLMTIPGLGPKTVALLWKQGGVESLDDLTKKLAEPAHGGLEEIKGLGKKSLEKIQHNLAFKSQADTRMRLGRALPLAEGIVQRLRAVAGVQRISHAGSLRRGRETIGDVDILVAADADAGDRIFDAFVALPEVDEVILRGDTKASVRLKDRGLQVDLRIVPPAVYGAALMYFTGSKEHNVALRTRAIARGLKLSEYGLFDAGEEAGVGAGATARPQAAETEEQVYRALGLAWIPPELREDHGEIKSAEADELPQLITIDNIKADLHTHTVASDGVSTIEEMARAAAARRYHTLAITDHSKGQVQANGLSPDRLEKHIIEIREVAKRMEGTIQLLAGSEVDILADGTLDYPDSLLKELDVVVASPHAALSQEPEKATARLLRAIENPYVTILGHPTGRLVAKREGLSPDIHALCKAAAERGIAMEINANSYRLDLRDTHARVALDAGCKLAINTDAHGPGDFLQLRYGILTARRAGATAGDVVNTFSRAKLGSWLRSTRP